MMRTPAFTLIIFLGLVTFPPLVTSAEASGTSPETAYENALQCRERLSRSSALKKRRAPWERCIHAFDSFVHRHPHHRFSDRALFYLGELYRGLYGYSGKTSDLEQSLKAYRTLKEEYPSSPLALVASERIEKNQKPSPGSGQPPPASSRSFLPVRLQAIRYWSYPDYTRVVLDLDRPVVYRVPASPDHTRLTLELYRTEISDHIQKIFPLIRDGILREVTPVQVSPTTVRIAIAVDGLHDSKIFPLRQPDRLVIDIFGSTPQPRAPNRPTDEIKTIVIDPGHGGHDPGAVGRTGLTEKEVVLDIGVRLRDLIEKRLGKKVVMTREKDIFIPLEERTQLANGRHADLFVSIHANSHPVRSTRGVEIYLFGQATNRRARITAARENGVSSREVAGLERILKSLTRDYNVNQSLEFAHFTRSSFRNIMSPRYEDFVDLGVKKAPFYVLTSAQMPSILAEVSFLSNPLEEKRLDRPDYRQAIAEALFDGVKKFVSSKKLS